jgi:hypothetical protein
VILAVRDRALGSCILLHGIVKNSFVLHCDTSSSARGGEPQHRGCANFAAAFLEIVLKQRR